MVKFIVAFFVVVFFWVGWLALLMAEIAVGIWLPIVLTVFVGLTLVLLTVLAKLRARRAAAQLEKALTEQAAQYAQNARPDLQAEVMEMKVEFEKAVGALKTSKLGRGKDALYALPWQIIIGPPGSGKTTALRNSGLQFPYLSESGGAVRGLGGTRNCDWWLTNEAVILDTAGRWTTQEEDRDEWLGFLDLVKRFRPKKPLNGILVALSVSDIGGATEDAAAVVAQKVRERVDEAMNRLQMSLPVYVVFTKCDLIPGFIETFGDLSKNDRGQVWGFTVPMQGGINAGAHFTSRFDSIVTQVQARQLKRMSEERRVESRDTVYVFPQQLCALKTNMAAFVAQLFEENVFRETPYFRGVYFTSGTQEGSPIDRVMGRMAEAFGVQTAFPIAAAATTTPKSYFLRDVFREVVFKDASLAARSEEELRRQRRVRYIMAAAMFGIAAMLLTLPAFSWTQNAALMEEAKSVLEVERPPPNKIPGVANPLSPEKLERLHRQVTFLEKGAPLSMGAGMYRGDVIEEPLRQFHMETLRARVVAPLVESLKRELDAFGREYEDLRHESPSRGEFDLNRRRLRVYLLVTSPTEANQPGLRGELSDELTRDLASSWASTLQVEANSRKARAMKNQMRWFVRQLSKDPVNTNFKRDAKTVKRVRVGLMRVSFVDLAINGFISQFENRGLDVTLPRVLGRRTERLKSRRIVRAAFTKEVYDNAIREQIETSVDVLTGAAWVVSDPSGSKSTRRMKQARIEKVRETYFKRYIEEWDSFLRSIRVDAPDDKTKSLEFAQFLISGEPTPYRSLFERTHQNTNLAPERDLASRKSGKAAQKVAMGKVGRVAGKSGVGRVLLTAGRSKLNAKSQPTALTEESVAKAFAGFTRFGVPGRVVQGMEPVATHLVEYEEQLLYMRNAIQTAMDSDDEAELLEATKKARTTIKRLRADQEKGWRPVFEKVLWIPLEVEVEPEEPDKNGKAEKNKKTR